MHGLDMPDEEESLTISSISHQSPFHTSARAASNRAHQQTMKQPQPMNLLTTDVLRAQYEHPSTENDFTTLGRSEET
jgi:hypothetical protein